MRRKNKGRLAAGLVVAVLAVSAFTVPAQLNRTDADTAGGPAAVSTQTNRDQDRQIGIVSKNRKSITPGRKVGSPTPPTPETLNWLVGPEAAADRG